MNVQLDLFSSNISTQPRMIDLQTKIEQAIRLLKSAGQAAEKKGQPVEISYSGGKDSDVILELARMSGINFRAIYKNTTIDPPGTIKHCIGNGVEIMRRKSFAKVIQMKGYPTFKRRFCCRELKEYKILDISVQGIRRSESTKRAKRYKEPTVCRLYGSKKKQVEVFLPILNWTDADVTEFITQRGIECHPLYYDKQGNFCTKCRLGCMGCPQKSDRGLADFKAHPRLVKFWLCNGEIWWKTHKLKKTKMKFKNHYEIFVCNVFCKSYEDFIRKFGPNLFYETINCKDFLSDYFGIKL